MFDFAYPIIARSQCWLFTLKYPYLPLNIHIFPLIQCPVSAQWSQRLSGKVQGKMVHKIVFLLN